MNPSISTIPNEAIPATSSSAFVSKNLYAEDLIGGFTNDNIPKVCRASIQIGKSTESTAGNLSGTGGTYQLTINIDTIPIAGHPKDISLGTENAYHYWTEEFLVPANAGVAVYLKSPNASETAIDVSTTFYDINQSTIDAINDIRKVVDKLTFTDDDNLMTDSSDISTEVAAIKEKTDQLVFDSDGNLEVTATVDEDAIAADVVTGLLAAPEFARLVPGTGAYKYEFNVKYNGTVASLPDVSVYLYNASTLLPANIVAYGLSNNQGVVNFYLNAGTYYAVQVKAGYTFENPEIITVEAT